MGEPSLAGPWEWDWDHGDRCEGEQVGHRLIWSWCDLCQLLQNHAAVPTTASSQQPQHVHLHHPFLLTPRHHFQFHPGYTVNRI